MGKIIRLKFDDETDLWLRRHARMLGIGVCGLLKKWVREDVARSQAERRQAREAAAVASPRPEH